MYLWDKPSDYSLNRDISAFHGNTMARHWSIILNFYQVFNGPLYSLYQKCQNMEESRSYGDGLAVTERDSSGRHNKKGYLMRKFFAAALAVGFIVLASLVASLFATSQATASARWSSPVVASARWSTPQPNSARWS